jgi:hypothetical protein
MCLTFMVWYMLVLANDISACKGHLIGPLYGSYYTVAYKRLPVHIGL